MQRVDRAEYDVAVLIDEFNHLLQSAVGTVAHQSAKLADAVVFMYDVVAHFNLVQFFQREGEFARASAVALEIIAVESIENLVVGKHAHLQLVVNEALVNGAFYRGKRNFVVAVVENHTQARGLLLAVAEDV